MVQIHDEAAGSDPETDSWGGDTDWSLIRKAAGRDQGSDRDRAWVRLIERYSSPVLRCLRTQLPDDLGSEDKADEFFSYLFQCRVLAKATSGQERFRSYVQHVVRQFAQQVRRERRRELEPADDLEVGYVEADPQVERDEEVAWAHAVLEHALDRLHRATGRDAELLRHFYGIQDRSLMTGAELARAMGMSTNALNVALHRARARLREAIVTELKTLVSDAPTLAREFETLVDRLLEAHPGLVSADEPTTTPTAAP